MQDLQYKYYMRPKLVWNVRGKLNDGVKHDSNSGFNLKEKPQLIHKNCPHLKIVGNYPIFGDKEWKREGHHNLSL
jgi:hypothetical protein